MPEQSHKSFYIKLSIGLLLTFIPVCIFIFALPHWKPRWVIAHTPSPKHAIYTYINDNEPFSPKEDGFLGSIVLWGHKPKGTTDYYLDYRYESLAHAHTLHYIIDLIEDPNTDLRQKSSLTYLYERITANEKSRQVLVSREVNIEEIHKRYDDTLFTLIRLLNNNMSEYISLKLKHNQNTQKRILNEILHTTDLNYTEHLLTCASWENDFLDNEIRANINKITPLFDSLSNKGQLRIIKLLSQHNWISELPEEFLDKARTTLQNTLVSRNTPEVKIALDALATKNICRHSFKHTFLKMLSQKSLHWNDPLKGWGKLDLIIEGFDIALQLNPSHDEQQELLNVILKNHKPSYLIHNPFMKNFQTFRWHNYPNILTNELKDRLTYQSLQSKDSAEVGHILSCIYRQLEPSRQEVDTLEALLSKNTWPEHNNRIKELIERRHYSLDTVIEVDYESLRSPAVKPQD